MLQAAGKNLTRAGLMKAARNMAFTAKLKKANPFVLPGVDIHTIQRLLGHGHISTTTRYFQLTRHTEMGPDSPLDLLDRFAPRPPG